MLSVSTVRIHFCALQSSKYSILVRFLNGKSYIYRANALEKLTDMIGLLEGWFPGARLTADKSDIRADNQDKKERAARVYSMSEYV